MAPGDRVLLLMRDTPEFAAAWLGAVHAGAVAVALNTKLSEAEYRHIRADSGARLAIVEDVFARARPDLATEHASDGSLVIAGTARRAGAFVARARWRAPPPRSAVPHAARRKTRRSGSIRRAPPASPRASFMRTAACCRPARRSAK